MTGEKIVLAYSGGLDTSIILKWLIEKGNEVIAYIADVGQDYNYEEAKQKALALGASSVYIEDLRNELIVDYIWPTIRANAVYENRYLLGTAVARPIITKRHIEIAEKEGATCVSHGATGKGNDQVRFELGYYALNPNIKVYAPWKDQEWLDQFKGRTDMLNYAEKMNIPIKQSLKKPFSEDDNLMHISHEAGVLEDPKFKADKSMLTKMVMPQDAPDKEKHIAIEFKDGTPVKVIDRDNEKTYEDPLELFNYLNKVSGENGIGLLDMVENRYVGIKSRGVYETPAGAVLYEAHRDIEGISMDREVLKLRDSLSPKFAELVYNGYWFSPEMEFIMAAMDKAQEFVDGVVYLTLYKGNIIIDGRESPNSLYNEDLSSMDIEGGFDQKDSQGFIKINAIRLMAHHEITKNKKK